LGEWVEDIRPFLTEPFRTIKPGNLRTVKQFRAILIFLAKREVLLTLEGFKACIREIGSFTVFRLDRIK
jgi:hypothetical protein